MLFGAIRLLEYILYIFNNGTNSLSFEMIRTKKKILSKCFCFVTHGIYYFTTFVQLCWHDTIDEWLVCWYNLLCFKDNNKKSNLMTLDNSGIEYSRMLLFVLGFLVYWKIEPNSHASDNTWLMTWLQTGHVKVVRKTKCDAEGFMAINKVF